MIEYELLSTGVLDHYFQYHPSAFFNDLTIQDPPCPICGMPKKDDDD